MDDMATGGGLLAGFLGLFGLVIRTSRETDRKIEDAVKPLMETSEHERLCDLKIKMVSGAVGGLKEEFREFHKAYREDMRMLHGRLDELAKKG